MKLHPMKLVLALALTGCAGRPEPAPEPVCTVNEVGEKHLAAAHEHERAGDALAASRHHLKAAEANCEAFKACAHYGRAVATAFIAYELPLVASATEAWLACIEANTEYVPSQDQRLILAVGARLSGKESPFAIPLATRQLLGHVEAKPTP